MSHRLALFLLVALGGAGLVCAQPAAEVQVQASAQPMEVGTNGQVTFTIRVDGAARPAVATPEAPPTSNLVLQQGAPATRQTLSFEDGQPKRSVSFEWTYKPLRAGTARIQPATVRVRGERYTTGEIQVQVVPQSEWDPPQQRVQPHAGRSTGVASTTEAAKLGPRSLFIRGRTSSETAYQNEQVTVEYRLFFRPSVRLRRSRMADAWDAPGFWREELDVSSRPIPETAWAYGQTYKTIVLKRVALFPTRPGSLQVDPLRIETEAQGAGRAFRGRYESLTLASDPLAVAVQPLPSGAPAGFDGAVGRFSVEARLARDSVQVGGGSELTVQVRGRGNLPTLSAPGLETPPAVDVYGPEITTNIDREGDEVRGTKTFAYTLVPGAGGRHVLPPIRFAYFNPATRRYETARTDSVVLQASGTAGPVATSRTGAGLPVGDVAGLMTTNVRWTRPDAPPLHRRWWTYVALLVPIALAGGAIAYRRRQPEEGAPAPEEDTSPDPLTEAHDRLRVAEQHADTAAVYQAVERAVRRYLADRLGVAPGLGRAQLDEHLARHEVSPADREALHDLLETCDRVQFAPEASTPDSSMDPIKHTQALLRRLDNAFPSA